ncbi:MAG: A/G-specific adenine glycosylase [Flavitalea sp.]
MSANFTRKLLKWNQDSNHRPMPWKGEKDPYRIWLSEIILQQTRVKQGWIYYENFISAFPTVHDLANANEATVFKLWEGLGYYSRCKNLIHSAKIISSELKGIFPRNYEEILKLKGVGPYTASAIASFAYDECKAVVDGNVQRVLARYFGISTPIDSTEGKFLFRSLAQSLINKSAPGIYNQAIMDFGATICKPKNPLCEKCIEADDCEAFQHGFVNTLPVKEKKLKKRTRWLYYFIVETVKGIYIRKREKKDIWQNLHEFILVESENAGDNAAQEYLVVLFNNCKYELIETSKIYTQQLTHQQIKGQFFLIRIKEELNMPGAYTLVSKDAMAGLAFPKFINNFLRDSNYYGHPTEVKQLNML